MDANPATSHMFIVNPLSGGRILKLFSTHPSIEKRITRLESMRSGLMMDKLLVVEAAYIRRFFRLRNIISSGNI